MTRPRLVTTVSLIALLCAAGAAQAKRVTVSIKGLKFQPDKVEVEAGDTVEWTNDDDRDHTVKAEDGSFNSGRLRSGKRFSRTFDQPGKFAYGDDLHPRMRGIVVVKKKD